MTNDRLKKCCRCEVNKIPDSVLDGLCERCRPLYQITTLDRRIDRIVVTVVKKLDKIEKRLDRLEERSALR